MFLKSFNKFLLLVLLLVFSLNASDKIKVFVLHSYSQEYSWTKKQHDAFISALNVSNNNFEYCIEYLDTKRIQFSKEYQKNFLAYLKMKYLNTNAEIVYVTDDNALEFIYDNYEDLFKGNYEPPVFFSGVNNLGMNDLLQKDTYAGVYEIKEIKPNIELIKQFSPQSRDIYFIGDNSNTYNSIKKEIESHSKNFKNMNFHYISDDYISNIENKLPNKPRSFVFLTTIGHIKDANGNTLLPKESIDIIRKNENLIILSLEDAYMHKGVIGGYMTSAQIQGAKAAGLVIEYLQKGSLDDVISLTKSTSTYVFNSKELSDSRVVLSDYIARKSMMIGKSKNIIEQNKSLLLNIFTIVLLILFFGSVTIYVLLRNKYNKLSEQVLELENIKMKLNAKNQFINNVLSKENIGYWRLDINADKLFISKELLEILNINSKIYKGDSNALSYFIHQNDKQVFHDNLQNVKDSKKSLTFNHRLVTSDKTVLDVKHYIYLEYMGYIPAGIVGILKIEK